MSEKSAQTKKKLTQNADKIAIAALVLILLGLGFAYFKEQNNGLGKEDISVKPANLQDQIAESPSYLMLQNMSDTPNMERDPDIQRVAQLNMFDASTVEAERALEQQGQAQIAQAQALIKEGKTDQARELLLQAKKVILYDDSLKAALDSVTTKSETAPGGGEGMPPQ